MKFLRLLTTTAAVSLALVSQAQTWKPMANQPPIDAAMGMLLTDGSVLVHETMGSGAVGEKWYKLTPNLAGSYSNGTWTQLASTPGYSPLYFASAVMADGRVFVSGGEYNGGSAVWTSITKVYDPLLNTWTSITPPPYRVGDAQVTVLDNGLVMLSSLADTRHSLFNPATNSFTHYPGTGKLGRHNEEGWVKLQDGSVLCANIWAPPGSQRFIPATNSWVDAGIIPVDLVMDDVKEIGPGVVMYDGRVLWIGAVGPNAYYTLGGGWTAGPSLPNGDGSADGGCVLMPNGKVLAAASPGFAVSPTRFYEFTGSSVSQVPAPLGAASNPNFAYSFLMLPTGEAMVFDQSNKINLYTSAGVPQAAWKPVITSVPAVLGTGQTIKLFGRQLNGLSECSNYGDDVSNSTNYPLVRVTNLGTGHVQYARTFNHSTMAIATGAATVSTLFKLPPDVEKGTAKLEVVTNGIASDPVTVLIADGNPAATTALPYYATLNSGTVADLKSVDDSFYRLGSTPYLTTGQQAGVFLAFKNAGPDSFSFRSSSVAGATEMLFLFNQITKKYDWIQSWQGSAALLNHTVSFRAKGIDTAKYVDSTGLVRATLRSIRASNKAAFTFDIDQALLL